MITMRPLLPIAVAVAIASSAFWRSSPAVLSMAQDCPTETGTGCAPPSSRVDLTPPSFTNPTNITNPLFPIGQITSALQMGERDGRPFRVEITLLPGTKVIEWNGQPIETRISQYVSYLDGRIHEVALDWYAQADDGAVWYLGEDVFNYRDGVVANTEGTWLAGRDGPAAMIMPGNPRVGDVYRPENIPGLVFEEVTIAQTGVTVDGPRGPVNGAIVVRELQMDGKIEEKIFAPGYGEFSTGVGEDLEAIALAVPTDALPGPPPPQLMTLFASAIEIFEAAQSQNWAAASATLTPMTTAWEAYQAGGVPNELGDQMSDALRALARGINAQNSQAAAQAALGVAQASLDFQLRYRPPTEIDAARFHLWTRQLLLDVPTERLGLVRGDVAALRWIRDRFAHTLSASDASALDAQLNALEAAANAGDLARVGEVARQLQQNLVALQR